MKSEVNTSGVYRLKESFEELLSYPDYLDNHLSFLDSNNIFDILTCIIKNKNLIISSLKPEHYNEMEYITNYIEQHYMDSITIENLVLEAHC